VRLKRIKVLGFKSFADKVLLDFHSGITGIVGPNGCGKSNISDAFRWVLGETSAKSLRGKKMEDVIFAGTSSRKALNFAEVTITLSEIQGLLPTDYDEIEITRRYHRSGESEYFINRQKVRMKDVQSLFLDTGIGKNAFSIFEQGKIDQVIQYSPLERRSIFEEAAGILRFLQRKREAMRKLELTDQNIAREMDILKEVEKQMHIREQQAEEAKLFKEKKQRYQDLELGLILAKWDSLKMRSDKVLTRTDEQENQIANANERLAVFERDLQKSKTHLEEGEMELRHRSEEVYQARSEKEIRTREQQSTSERFKESSAKEQRWQLELESILEKREMRRHEEAQAKEEQKTLEITVRETEKVLNKQKTCVKDLEEAVSLLRQKQQEKHQERLQQLQEESRLAGELKEKSIRLENAEERCLQINKRTVELKPLIAEHKSLVDEKREEVAALSKEIDRRKEELNKQEKKEKALSLEIEEAQQAFDKAQRESAESAARFSALKRLHDEMEGFSSGSKRLLQESANKKSPLYQKIKGLHEWIKPKKGAETALSTILRPYAQTLVADSEEDFKAAIAFAKKENLSDFSLISASTLPKAKIKKTPETFLASIEESSLAEHFLKSTLTVSDASAAFELMKTEEGNSIWIEDEKAFIDSKQVIFYTSQGENNVFVREAELKALEARIEELHSLKEESDEKISCLMEERALVYSARLELDKSIRRDEMTLIESNFSLQRLHADYERYLNEERQLTKEHDTLTQNMGSINESIALLSKEHEAASKRAEAIQEESEALNQELESKGSTLKNQQQDLSEKQSAYHTASDNLRKVIHTLHVLEVQDRESDEQMRRLKEEIDTNKELQSQFQERSSEYQKLLEEVEHTLEEVAAACTALENDVAERRKKIRELEEKIAKENERLKRYEEEEHKLNIQVAQADSARNALEEELQERHNLNIEELREKSIAIDKPIDAAEKELRALRRSLEQDQAEINMASIEEFSSFQKRYQFLGNQVEDLTESKTELLEIITKLDDQSRTLFQETFEQIRANFQKNFKILFGGGEADLMFTEEGDVLEAGIEITAKPPGKKMRSINLLSGGEKCLTAVALLFAIFEVKSAPFCILDEIDAPLDDSNVERFLNVVKQFVDHTQFIIITHNKRTMAICDRLFGVSMEERGVSKLLSMEFSRDEHHPEIVSSDEAAALIES